MLIWDMLFSVDLTGIVPFYKHFYIILNKFLYVLLIFSNE